LSALLILNPGSRAGRGRRNWEFWQNGLHTAGIPFRAVETNGPGHATALARADDEHDTVVAVGGDGTINEVLDGVLQAGRPEQRFGVLYSGTSPDFCRFHGIPTEPAAALRVLLANHSRPVDAVRIAYHDRAGAPLSAHFGCSANIGLGAAVARTSNRLRPWVGDHAGTGLALLRALLTEPRPTLDLEADDVPLRMPNVNNLCVMKNPYIASGLKLSADLRPDDGRLCLVAVAGKRLPGLLRLLPGFYSGRALRAPGVLVWKATRLQIRSSNRQEIEFDGDPRGFLPAEIELLPRCLNLIVPEGNPP
jgi:diacylglycerol kinase family enzyme